MNEQHICRVTFDTSEETRIREATRMREKALHDEASALYNAEQKGLSKGREEGRAEGREEERTKGREESRTEIIEKMRQSGMTDEQIKAIIGK